jgi:hypothetical protein
MTIIIENIQEIPIIVKNNTTFACLYADIADMYTSNKH